MKSHNGMRPQDIVVLLKILTNPDPSWQYRNIAHDLKLSVSEISESLTRSHMAGLVDESKRRVLRGNLFEFVDHGLHYVFPQVPGTMVNGMPTAHSHPYFKAHFSAELEYVWHSEEKGHIRGLSIIPLYKGVVHASLRDEQLHLLLAALDIYRVGRTREISLARKLLQKEILGK